MLTNRLTFDTDFAAINEAYTFLCFTWLSDNKNKTNKAKWANSHHLDRLLENEHAEACLFRYGRYAYAMFNRQNTPDLEAIRQRLASDSQYDHIQVDIAYASASYDSDKSNQGNDVVITGAWLYQILFNALANSVSQRLHFHNLNGALIYIPPITTNRRAKKLIAHEITVEKELVLNASAVTYQTKGTIYRTYTDKKQYLKKINLPAYEIGPNSLRRVYNHKDNWDIFIQAGVPGTKATSDALNIKDQSGFANSRMGILHALLERFNKRYQGLVSAHWEDLAVDKSVQDRLHILYKDPQFNNVLKSKRIRLVDKINNDESTSLIKDMQQQLIEMGLDASIGVRESKDALHICLIKPKHDYDTHDDPYSADERYSKQHITDEKYLECKKADEASKNKPGKSQRQVVLQNLLKELLIKQDVTNKCVTLFDNFDTKERPLYLEGTWVFGTIDKEGCHLLELTETGQLNYIFHDFAMLIHDHPYAEAVETVRVENEAYVNLKSSPIDAFIISSSGDVNIIKDYQRCVLPNLSLIEREISLKDAALPEHLTYPEAIIELIQECQTVPDKDWHNFTTELLQITSTLDKTTLRKVINQNFHTSSTQNKLIREKLLDAGVVLSVSKSKDKLFELMPDLFTICAGKIDDTNAWYSVGYYSQSLQQSLPHMVRIKQVKALKGNNLYQEILPLLDVDFVRFKASTVLPYPMKYLREMIAINNA